MLNVASTGIAATLLERGSTAHYTFHLPINLQQDGRSKVTDNAINARSTGFTFADEDGVGERTEIERGAAHRIR